MSEITRIGVDLAKNVIQVDAVDASGKVVTSKALVDARIIAAHLVAPYRLQGKSGKNDANDAAAIC